MAFNVSEVIAHAIESREDSVADNILEHNALLRVLKKNGGVKKFEGGTSIQEAVMLNENGNAGSYSNADVYSMGLSESTTAARYGIAQYAVPILMTGLEGIQTAGKAERINLLTTKLENGEKSLINLLSKHVYQDGTGNGGKNLTGLAAAIPLVNNTGTYGGINRAEQPNWRNKKFQASVDGTGVATSATLLSQWTNFLTQLIRGSESPNCIIASGTLFTMLKDACRSMKMLTSSAEVDAGFESIVLDGIPVYYDTAASGISNQVAYFLNTDYLRWRPFSGRDMKNLGAARSINQDVVAQTIVWAGNLTCRGAKFQGVFSNS